MVPVWLTSIQRAPPGSLVVSAATSGPILPDKRGKTTVDELVMVLEGDVEFEISGKVLRPAVGEELFISAGVLHSVRNTGKTTSRWLYGYQMNQS